MKELFESDASALAPPRWDWSGIRRVLIVRLRSIGDTVLSTPSLTALRRFLPDAEIDVLLEDWVAPILEGYREVDNVLTVRRNDTKDRLRLMWKLRSRGYDAAYNLHGGTTAGFFTAATLAKHRVGFKHYPYKFLYNHLAPASSELWQREKTHSAEQQLALLGWTGVPVSDRPKTRLEITEKAAESIKNKIDSERFALIHPVAAFESKQWATENFAKIADYLHEKGLSAVAVAAPKEAETLERLQNLAQVGVKSFVNLSLPEITALAARARIFVGNDSGIAHVAAAVQTPSVVIFGSSNIAHWRPWTNAPHEVVSANPARAPFAPDKYEQSDEPECIRRVSVEQVKAAIERVLH